MNSPISDDDESIEPYFRSSTEAMRVGKGLASLFAPLLSKRRSESVREAENDPKSDEVNAINRGFDPGS